MSGHAWRNRVEERTILEFERAMLPHLDAAYALARFLVRHDADAEDLVQDAYLRALRYFGSYRGGDGRAWLLAIVRRGCYDWLARRRGGPAVDQFDEHRHGIPSPEETPEEAVLRRGLRESIARAIDDLPVEFREVIVLRDIEDLPYREIALVLGIPLGTVMSRLARARRRLQSMLPLEDWGRSPA
jgi:RNA polymerase sigma-70 factor, ECF subfamily